MQLQQSKSLSEFLCDLLRDGRAIGIPGPNQEKSLKKLEINLFESPLLFTSIEITCVGSLFYRIPPLLPM